MKTNRIFILVSIALLSITSCKKDTGDVTKPVINLDEPREGQELLIGDEHGVHFEMELSDNVMLGSYKIEIHNNFNHHDHSTKSGEGTVAFFFSKEYDLSGKKNAHIHHHEIKIPSNATEGDYHLMVFCTDAAGNEASVARNIVLSLTAKEDKD